MPAPRDTLHASASAEPTLVHTPAGVTPDARIVDPNAPTFVPLTIEPTRTGLARPPRQEDAPAPAQIGRFTVIRELGRGGTGVVYAAYDEQLDRKVAVKLLHSETREDLARTRLLREAQAMARLSHPNIVGVHEVDTFGRQIYVAMEFVHGVTLHSWLKRRRRGFAEVVAMFRQAGEGLAAAHAAGLVHRDFKPANVMVGDDGRVRVLDFGLARVEAAPGAAPGLDDLEPAGEHASAVANLRSLDASITVTGVMLGTPAYMAAEQFLGVRVDARSDQFAFCVALFEAAYAARPFPGDTLAELMTRVLAGTVRDVPTPPGVPRGLRPLLLRGLQRRPEDRWPAMRPLLDALAPFARRPVGRTWGAGVGLAALCVGGGIGAGYQLDVFDPTCSGGEDRIAAVWNPEVRERLTALAHDSGLAQAEATWERASDGLEEYAERWVDAHEAACADSDALLDLRMTCLAERRSAFAMAIGMYSHLDADVLMHSDQMIAELPRIESCAEESYLRAELRPPDDPAVRAQVDALRNTKHNALAHETSGKFDEAVELLLPAIAAAPPSYPQVGAELALVEGSLREQQGRYEDARAAFERAFFLAVESSYPAVAVDAATRLAYVVGRRLGDAYAAKDWLKHAEIYAERHGDPLRRARVRTVHGALANAGQLMIPSEELRAEAAAAFTDARRLYLEAGAQNTVDFARYLRFHGDHLARHGSVKAAIAVQRQALLALEEAKVGPQHPDVAMIHNSLGIALMDAGDYEAALATLQAGLDAAVDLPRQRNHVYMTLWFNKASTLQKLGRLAEAERPAREAIAVLERSSERLLTETFSLHVELARLLHELGRPEAAERELTELLTRADQAWGPRETLRMDALLPLSRLRLAAGEPQEALELAEQALDMCQRATLPSHRAYAPIARWHLARALAELGQRSRALELANNTREFVIARRQAKDMKFIAEIDAFRRELLAAEGAPP